MAKKDSKDTVLSLNLDIMRQIEENKEYAESDAGKERLEVVKEDIIDLKKTLGIDDTDDIQLRALTNEEDLLTGKDYYFNTSDRFEEYPLYVSGIEKLGNEVAPYILNRFKDNVEDSMENIPSDMDEDRKKMHLIGYKKLIKNINKNIKIIRRNGNYAHDEYYDNIINKTAYPIFQDVNYFFIRINL